MHRYASIPLLFFVLAAAIGLFLRWQFILPTPGIRYTWFLHAHSHIMFLGWVTNVLFLAFIRYLPEKDHKPALRWFVPAQILVAGMLITFPLQGYGLYSITFSTLHTFLIAGLAIVFLRRTQHVRTTSMRFARPALLFFALSTFGPFSLGYLMSQGMSNTVWYNFSIYYYLHFQYNGFFTFGVLALFYQLLDDKGIAYNQTYARRFALWLAFACVPAYALSVLYANPGLGYNAVGAAAALAQTGVVVLFSLETRRFAGELRRRIGTSCFRTLQIVWLGWVVKTVLQLISAHPEIAQLAYTLRPVVIAYLHLVLLGVITLFLLAWYMINGHVEKRQAASGLVGLTISFILSEIVLVMVPWWHTLTRGMVSHTIVMFLLSLVMWTGAFQFWLASLRMRLTKITP